MEIFRNLNPRFYRVHAIDDTWAQVTEGSAFMGGVWERARCDWSQPNNIRIQALDGNAFGAGSTWLYVIDPTSDGAHIHFELRRVPRSFKGHVLAMQLAVRGTRVFGADLESTLARVRETSPALVDLLPEHIEPSPSASRAQSSTTGGGTQHDSN